MPRRLRERDWRLLLTRIRNGDCTPFLGAGACQGVSPLAADIARKWAVDHRYPLEGETDLVKIAQFMAVQYDAVFPKDEIAREFEADSSRPDFTDVLEPHRFLAELPLPVYMTTNYDDFMVQALRHHRKDPKKELCKWNRFLKDSRSIFEDDPEFEPNPANPVVFHLHGHLGNRSSLVITEDDYLDFLVNIWRDPHLIPPRIQRALSGSSLMFIGYRLTDWTFRVLFRGLVTATEASGRRVSVTVQLPPFSSDATEDQKSKAEQYQDYLSDYFGKIQMRVFWGTAREFVSELRQRWAAFGGNGNGR